MKKKPYWLGVLPVFVSAVAGFSTSTQAADLGGNALSGEKKFGQCLACHQVGSGAKNAFGPQLNGLIDRAAGSVEGFGYSASLAMAGERGLVWTEEELDSWLSGPSDYLKKHLGDDSATSKMPVQFADEGFRKDIIAYLGTLSAPVGEKETMSHGGTPFDEALVDHQEVESDDPVNKLERVTQLLVAPPQLPEHTQKAEGDPKVVVVELSVEEKKWVLDGQGTEIVALTFNGSIPAPAIVVHQNDYVQLTLKNPASNRMVHNIDLHAATGALGGAAITTISPGEEVTIRFKATKTGAFLYHCAPEGSMTPYHVTHGMTGAIMVLPREGLTDDKGQSVAYDKAYYVGENDFYVPRDENGEFKKYSEAGEDLNDWIRSMKTLTPSHIVFNGRVGALTGKGSMRANVGDTVLFLHMQGNRDTRPHLIGGHGDLVWETGSFASPPLRDLETWFVRGGSVGAAIYTFLQPGIYAYLNHNLIEAVEFGAAAHVVVKGEWNDDLLRRVSKGPLK